MLTAARARALQLTGQVDLDNNGGKMVQLGEIYPAGIFQVPER
jgi:hypothetical protein